MNESNTRSKLRGIKLATMQSCGVFGLRSAPVGAKRVPLAHSGLRSAPVGAKRVPLAHSGLRSAPVGAKRAPLAHSALAAFAKCASELAYLAHCSQE